MRTCGEYTRKKSVVRVAWPQLFYSKMFKSSPNRIYSIYVPLPEHPVFRAVCNVLPDGVQDNRHPRRQQTPQVDQEGGGLTIHP